LVLQGLGGVWVSQSSRAFATGSGYVAGAGHRRASKTCLAGFDSLTRRSELMC
jgi:hypothetical protein